MLYFVCTRNSSKGNLPMTPKPILYVITNNHFDLTWRRCWQRPLQYKHQSFISYTDIETYYMLDNLALAREHAAYKFEAESAMVVRAFLERYPEKLADLQHLAREGRFAITGGGEAIIDGNMVHGESLVRNYVDGLLWVEETFGQKTRLGVRNDAFGNSAQLPQILRGCEIAWATGMSYSPAGGLYWRGLDGSTILHRTLPVVAQGGGVVKYPPCATCTGTGIIDGTPCPACHGRGIDPQLVSNLPGEIDQAALAEFGAGIVQLTPEELLPNPAVIQWTEAMGETYDVRFALEEDVLPHLRPWLAEVDHPTEDDLHASLELNPNNSGVLVTRIKTKQNVRRQEHALLAVEALWAMCALQGSDYPKDALKSVRRQQYFTMFHDAITATHVDAAYEELKDIWKEIDRETTRLRGAALARLAQPAGDPGLYTVINPTGNTFSGACTVEIGSEVGPVERTFVVKDLPPFSARQVHLPAAGGVEPLAQPVIENQRYRITADEHGLVEIYDKALGRAAAVSEAYRPGELVLEHDEGSPWATLAPDQSRTPLGPYTRLVSAEQAGQAQRLVFEVKTPWTVGFSSLCLEARVTVELLAGLDQVNFRTHANWDAFNHRLRAAFSIPRGEAACKHLYEIPYGMIERQPYAPEFRWAGPNGDWPAIHWAGVEQPGMSVALFNKGTPSYRMETGPTGQVETIFVSLLRSPAIPTYLHEPYFYTMTDYDGMRDSGEHDFDYALRAYAQPFADSSVTPDAENYNAAPVITQGNIRLPALPVIESHVARITALKWAEDGDGLVLRVVEFRGQGGEVTVTLPHGMTRVERTNLLERQAEALPIRAGAAAFKLRPWEIATLKVR